MLIAGDQVHASSAMLQRPDTYSQAEWEATTKHFLDEGEYFLAYEHARTAREHFPASLKLQHLEAQALLKTGAIEEARKILEPLCPEATILRERLGHSYATLRMVLERISTEPPDEPSMETLDALAELFQEIARVPEVQQKLSPTDGESLSLLASAYKDTWERSGHISDARQCRDTYLRAFKNSSEYYPGINAATMSWLLDEKEASQNYARQTLIACEKSRDMDRANRARDNGEAFYWNLATTGEAHLLLGNEKEAIAAYREAAPLAEHNYGWIVSSLHQLRMLSTHHFPVPEELFTVLKPPTVVAFVGHMIDLPGRSVPRFPPYLEHAVRTAIDESLEKIDARIGYCSAACGSDLLFIEAMHDRDAEVNIVLPFDQKDFIGTSIQPAGPRWVARFNRAVRLTGPRNPLRYVTEEKHLGDDVLFAFACQIFFAYAHLRARTLGTVPHLLAVWDGKANNLVGGTAHTIDRWPDKETLHIVDLDEILKKTPAPPAHENRVSVPPLPDPSTGPTHPYKREIKTMLFADVVGFSKIGEEFMPYYMYQFLERVAEQLHGLAGKPGFVNTWGDAIFAVMDRAVPLAEYALALQKAVCQTNWADLGLPSQMSIRIGLHAGPVFVGTDPIMGRQNFYGSHVNRAARIEPITIPGCVYASEQFTALLSDERQDMEQQARREGQPFDFQITWEPVGKLPLAKNFGSQTIYHIRRRFSSPSLD